MIYKIYLDNYFYVLYLADCPAGTRYNGESKCEDCPLHQYQDQPAQSRCMPCPKGFITEAEKAVSMSQCKGQDICFPNYFIVERCI